MGILKYPGSTSLVGDILRDYYAPMLGCPVEDARMSEERLDGLLCSGLGAGSVLALASPGWRALRELGQELQHLLPEVLQLADGHMEDVQMDP